MTSLLQTNSILYGFGVGVAVGSGVGLSVGIGVGVFVGTGVAVEFRAWEKIYQTLPSIEDIFDGKKLVCCVELATSLFLVVSVIVV